MRYGEIKKCDIANGEGVRVSLFVSGCTHHCKGCFNEATWDFDYGKEFTQETEEEILKALEPEYVKKVKERYPGKTIWCYTGYLFDRELCKKSRARCEVTDEMLALLDVLVDGRFVEEKKNIMLLFRGSSNQRLIDVKKSLEQGSVAEWNPTIKRGID